jgi:hypothetical protein
MCIAIKYNGRHVQSHVGQRVLLSVVGMSLGDESEIVAQQVGVAYCTFSCENSQLAKRDVAYCP